MGSSEVEFQKVTKARKKETKKKKTAWTKDRAQVLHF